MNTDAADFSSLPTGKASEFSNLLQPAACLHFTQSVREIYGENDGNN